VFADRSMAWALSECGLQSAKGFAACADPFIVIMADGMDQAKWRLPRFPGLVKTHKFGKFIRPTVIVEAIYIVGHRLDFYILDKDQEHGSSSIIECIAQSLEKLAKQLDKVGKKVPPTIIYWSDNTVRESKNQWMFKFWGTQILHERVRLILQMHLPVGHTHDKLGASLT
jgi:hypothetical protein